MVEHHPEEQCKRVGGEERVGGLVAREVQFHGPRLRGVGTVHVERSPTWFPRVQNQWMHIPAKADYGVRALLALASAGEPRTAEELAQGQGLPSRFLGAILNDLRRAGRVVSQRGSEGGYRLARPASEITIADVIRALVGPLAEIRGERPEVTTYQGAAEHLQDVWVAVRAALRDVLDNVTLEQVATGNLPASIVALTQQPDAWAPR